MIEYFTLIIVGSVMIVAGFIQILKQKKIKRLGIITEGIVFKLSENQQTSSNVQYPVIRFLTLSQEWITANAFSGMFPGFYKIGQKVKIIYLPEDPKQFIIDSKINSLTVYLILIIGFIMAIVGACLFISIKL